MIQILIILALISYFIGAIPFSLIISKLIKGVDVRREGSGNIGATNTLVTSGKLAGSLALIFDVAKGFSAVLLAKLFIGGDIACLIAGVFVVLGHDFSIYLKFNGGKGLAATVGAMIAINPYVVFICLAAYVVFLCITRYLILSSLMVLAVSPLIFYFLKESFAIILFSIIIFIVALYAHRGDIDKLVSGREKPIFEVLKGYL
ncbi:MAG: acyl-phosphate glycerol 3-phosphate acyltransferase [Candidatus Saganbacteria bacterium]|uniref:Glycerol-3-phosphate acyltransferase n=1 Tax=Candidatus Saganbacteria bacterium TaxID=2575572 RepID=A0A833NZ18_UNCSA|nr:MAG: acyl-phosphate glycerol 3-phosphate acyltransferase [Candidatus Saganbacteria bacterium]